MPNAHRSVLAPLAQLEYYRRHAPEERTPQFLHQTPQLDAPRDADPIWRFDPSWRFVPDVQRGEHPLDPEPDPWLIDDMETPVRLSYEDGLRRRQEADRNLALLASGGPIG